jgi:hypothetical protein
MFALAKDSRAFRYATIAVAAQFLVMIFISVFRLGGEKFISGLFDVATPVYAAITALSVFLTWKTTSLKGVVRSIWGWMALGFFLWMIAEVLWLYYAILYQEAIPFPSPADYFWIMGYGPLVLSLLIRIRSFQVTLVPRQVMILVSANIVFIIFSALCIFLSFIMGADPARWQETAINVLYAVGDLLIFGLSLDIFFTVRRGRFSIVWNFLLMANIIAAIADLMFTYASGNKSSLSDGTFYAIYVAYNVPYLSSYLLIALGMLANHVAISATQQDTTPLQTLSEADSNLVLLFTNAENKLVGASQNFARLVGVENVKELSGCPLHELLGIELRVIASLMEAGGKKGYVSSYPVEICIAGQKHIQAYITATSDKSATYLFNGLNIVMRVKACNLGLTELDAEFETIAQRILSDTGQTSRENIASLNEYFKAQVLGLYRTINSLGGAQVAQTMMDGFNKTARSNRWDIEFKQQSVFVQPQYTEEQLGKAFSLLLKDIKSYAIDVVNAQVVADEMLNIERSLNSRTIRVANDFGLRDL